jgi:hypothetical protein
VKFPAPEITLKDALTILEMQTGNKVLDLRKVHASNPKLMLKSSTFWETLDTLGKEQGIGFSPYHADGAIALIDSPYRPMRTHYSGPFRFAFKRISVTRDEETQTHFSQLLSNSPGSRVFGRCLSIFNAPRLNLARRRSASSVKR